MTIHWPPITVVIPQLSSWSHSDYINAVIAGVAVVTLIASFFASRKRDKTTIQRLNREERIRIYAFALAGLRARSAWAMRDLGRTHFNRMSWESGELLVINADLENENENERTTDQAKEDHQIDSSIQRIRSWEFDAEFDLLASEPVILIWNDIQDKYDVGRRLFRESIFSLNMLIHSERIVFDQVHPRLAEIKAVWRTTVREVDDLISSMRNLIIEELEIQPTLLVKCYRWLKAKLTGAGSSVTSYDAQAEQ